MDEKLIDTPEPPAEDFYPPKLPLKRGEAMTAREWFQFQRRRPNRPPYSIM